MTLLEVDPNWVKPGWTPLLITIALAALLVMLFLSMRQQFRKINAAGDLLPTEQSLRERRAAGDIRIDREPLTTKDSGAATADRVDPPTTGSGPSD